MKLSNVETALALYRAAARTNDSERQNVMTALAQTLCDRPTGIKFREYAAHIAGLPEMPDDQWALPPPPEDVAMRELGAAVNNLNALYGQDSIRDWILYRMVSWKAANMARIKEAESLAEIRRMILNNGNHTAFLWHPQMYTRRNGEAIPLDSAEGRAALMEDLEVLFPTTEGAIA